MIWGGFPKIRGTILEDYHDKDYRILGSVLGSPYFGELPCSDHTTGIVLLLTTDESLGQGCGAANNGSIALHNRSYFVAARSRGTRTLTNKSHMTFADTGGPNIDPNTLQSFSRRLQRWTRVLGRTIQACTLCLKLACRTPAPNPTRIPNLRPTKPNCIIPPRKRAWSPKRTL